MSGSASSWHIVDAAARPGPREVLLVRLEAQSARPSLDAALSWLSQEELARAERLRVPLAREEFVLARACLHALLGAALACDGRAIAFTTGSAGRPSVAAPPAARIDFNVTHSRGLILIALSRDAAVGVGIEAIDPAIEALELSQRNFAPDEQHAIASAPDEATRARIFFRLWTRKEAVLKAHGGGLLLGLDSFSVLEQAAELRVHCGGAQPWFVRDLDVPPGFSAALALDRPNLSVRSHVLETPGLTRLLRASAPE